jgi:phosphoglycerate dehydrogenase-like enzyme
MTPMTVREKTLLSIAAWKSYESEMNAIEISALQNETVDDWAIFGSLNAAYLDICKNEPVTETSGLVEMQRIMHLGAHAKSV